VKIISSRRLCVSGGRAARSRRLVDQRLLGLLDDRHRRCEDNFRETFWIARKIAIIRSKLRFIRGVPVYGISY
jgi:hypothetical protein